MNTFNFKKVLLILLIIFIFLLLVFSVFFSLININNLNILNGITINGIDVSNLSKDEAINKLSNLINDKSSNNIIISLAENNQITTSFDSLEINYAINSSVSEAYNIGRSGNIFKNNFDIFNLIFNKKNIDLKLEINNNKLENLIENISSNVENRVIPSSYYIEGNKLVLVKGKDGNDVDKQKFIKILYDVLNDISSKTSYIDVPITSVNAPSLDIDQIYTEVYKEAKNAYYEKNPLKVYPEVVGISFDKNFAINLLQGENDEYEIDLTFTNPEITLSDLDINIFQDSLSSFSTEYNVSNIDRTTNLQLATSKINGTILSPGDEFSYNKIVGARTIEAGYKEAKVYSNGEVVDGIGGGICQISSTLYNSVVLANLEVTERHKHQFLTSYVPAGRDATVSYGAKDFKFKNTRSYPIKIEVTVDNGTVLCNICGIKENVEYDVDFDIETVSLTNPPTQYKQDDSLSYGVEKIIQRGSNGAVVNVYKLVKVGEDIISRTLLSQDSYNALEKIILRNSTE